MSSEEDPADEGNRVEESNAEATVTGDTKPASPGDSKAAHETLKYQLLGPSLTKAGQDSVDQSKVSEIIYEASKGSKFFNHEEARDKVLTTKIAQILAKKKRLETQDLSRELRKADTLIAELELSRDLSQTIVHIDCDAFYAAVELLDRPELANVPFAVGGGVLTTCNYIARRYGCRSGMAGFVAKRLCPELIVLRLNFDKYNAKATEVRKVLARYDPRFESASIDEAYLNLTAYCEEHSMDPEEAVAQLRAEVRENTKVTVSAGIAANARLAKICSNMNKPDGQFRLPSDRTAIMAFMRDLPCRKVNGVGRVLERELSAIGIKTCGDIYEHRQFLRELVGEKAYEFLLRVHLGLGRTSVQPAEEHERKSVSSERTFRDLSDPAQLRAKLRESADDLGKDLQKAECKGRTLALKVKLHTFEVLTRQVVPPKALCLPDDLYNYSLPILVKLEQEIPGLKLRLLGLRCSNLVSTKKPDTLAFFGLKPSRRGDSVEGCAGGGKTQVGGDDDGQWEQWPEEMLVDGYEVDSEGPPGDGNTDGKDAAGVTPEKMEDPTPPEEEWWDCPVCSRPQAADERRFNEHVDLCLSRQAIRDAVQQHAAVLSEDDTPGPEMRKQQKPSSDKGKKRRGRPAAGPDPRQKKLCFGP